MVVSSNQVQVYRETTRYKTGQKSRNSGKKSKARTLALVQEGLLAHVPSYQKMGILNIHVIRFLSIPFEG